jgi:hypothetical protein
MRIITSGYVDALGMKLSEGADLPPSAAPGEPLLAPVNRTLAEHMWPGERAVGQTLEIRGQTRDAAVSEVLGHVLRPHENRPGIITE